MDQLDDTPAPSPEQEELLEHHAWFCRLTKNMVDARVRHGIMSPNDRVLQCCRSIKVFEATYPNVNERVNMLKDLESGFAMIREDIEEGMRLSLEKNYIEL